jgi:hypothetical protein
MLAGGSVGALSCRPHLTYLCCKIRHSCPVGKTSRGGITVAYSKHHDNVIRSGSVYAYLPPTSKLPTSASMRGAGAASYIHALDQVPPSVSTPNISFIHSLPPNQIPATTPLPSNPIQFNPLPNDSWSLHPSSSLPSQRRVSIGRPGAFMAISHVCTYIYA